MNSWQHRVRQFNQAVGYDYVDLGSQDWEGQALQLPAFEGRALKLLEEAHEFAVAVERCDLPEAIDALVDAAYIVFGTADLLGVDLDPFFYLVHQANMQKPALGARVDHATGRVPKPEGWLAPDIRGLYDDMYGDRDKAVTVLSMAVEDAADALPEVDRRPGPPV